MEIQVKKNLEFFVYLAIRHRAVEAFGKPLGARAD
jgi:hypothetical protein